ncbi:MAG: hypothetical protein H6R07_1759 [Proteobacteria bacterium]|nr:hypothetical protein [Pseudomonadota bacterium]
MTIELILGGARSGKSRYALNQVLAQTGPVAWVATAQAHDDEMRERIAHHRAERPAHWQTVEVPLQLAAALAALRDRFVVVDCLTLWLTNWLCREDTAGWQAERRAFLAELAQPRQQLLLVSNEVGFGIVPDNALARLFRDEAGRLHQDIAAIVPQVTLVVAGIPMNVKKET